MADSTCSIDDCGRPAVARGWCPAHWYRWSTHGDPMPEKPVAPYRAIDHPDGSRTCSKCGERKPLEEFAKVKNATLGRRSDCKACKSAAMKAWYAANDERQAGRARERRATNPEVHRERDRQRNKAEHRRELHEIQSARRRARLSSRPVDPGVTRANLRKQYGDLCFYCGTAMAFERIPRGTPLPLNLATVEHVYPVALGGSHTWDNVVLACWSCNCSKRHLSLADWNPKD